MFRSAELLRRLIVVALCSSGCLPATTVDFDVADGLPVALSEGQTLYAWELSAESFASAPGFGGRYLRTEAAPRGGRITGSRVSSELDLTVYEFFNPNVRSDLKNRPERMIAKPFTVFDDRGWVHRSSWNQPARTVDPVYDVAVDGRGEYYLIGAGDGTLILGRPR